MKKGVLPILLLATPAWADVPTMGSAATCAQVAQSLNRPELLPRCLGDEVAALTDLESHWASLPLDIAGGCVARELEGGPGSYQILKLCIEDGLAAASLPSPFAP